MYRQTLHKITDRTQRVGAGRIWLAHLPVLGVEGFPGDSNIPPHSPHPAKVGGGVLALLGWQGF